MTMDAIKLNYPPEYILKYAQKIAADAKKDNLPQAQILMTEDFVKLIEIATKVLTPAGKQTNQKS